METSAGQLIRSRTFEAELLDLPKNLKFHIKSEDDLNTKHIDDLVVETKENLEENEWSSLVLDYGKFEDLELCFEFVKEAAKCGDNVGQDEFENDELFENLKFSEIFVLKNISNGNIKVFITIQPYLGSRSIDCCQTLLSIYYDQMWMNEGHNFLKNEISPKDVIYSLLVLLGIKLTKDIKIGYTDVIIFVCPTKNQHRMRLLQKIGFHYGASIPRGILINGSFEEDYIMVKSILPPRNPRHSTEILKTTDQYFRKEEIEQLFSQKELLDIPYLPYSYQSNKGDHIRIRCASKKDAESMYNMLKEASQECNGYGLHEYPTLSYFKTLMLDSYNVVYEIQDPRKDNFTPLAFSMIQKSWLARSKKAKIGESSTIIVKQARGRGFAKEIIVYDLLLIKLLGFNAIVNDYLENNVIARNVIQNSPKFPTPVSTGLIPRSNYSKKLGWEGQIIFYIDLNRPFMDIMLKKFKEKHSAYRLNSKL